MMAALCSNRPEGFGPASIISSPLPTTCFTDTIIIPLPVWLLLVATILLPLIYHRSTSTSPSSSNTPHTSSAAATHPLTITSPTPSSSSSAHSTTPATNPAPRTTHIHKTVATLYYFLLAAQILMVTLELVRIDLQAMGVSLLPFQYVALLLGGLIHTSVNSRLFGRWTSLSSASAKLGFDRVPRGAWIGLLGGLWGASMVVSILKVAALALMFDRSAEFGDLERDGSMYPLSDQIIDVAVMAGVYGALVGLEGLLGVWRGRRVVVGELERGEKR